MRAVCCAFCRHSAVTLWRCIVFAGSCSVHKVLILASSIFTVQTQSAWASHQQMSDAVERCSVLDHSFDAAYSLHSLSSVGDRPFAWRTVEWTGQSSNTWVGPFTWQLSGYMGEGQSHLVHGHWGFSNIYFFGIMFGYKGWWKTGRTTVQFCRVTGIVWLAGPNPNHLLSEWASVPFIRFFCRVHWLGQFTRWLTERMRQTHAVNGSSSEWFRTYACLLVWCEVLMNM